MQKDSMDTLIQLIVEMLNREKKRVLFLLTASNRNRGVINAELQRLMDKYPDSKICVDDLTKEESSIANREEGDVPISRILHSRRDIRQEVLLADKIAAVSFDVSTLRKVSLGINDSSVTFACMEALLQGKRIIAAEEDYQEQLLRANTYYRSVFEEAKQKAEKYGFDFCGMHEIADRLEKGQTEAALPGGKRQVITLETLAKEEKLRIAEDAIITPAARELLIGNHREADN